MVTLFRQCVNCNELLARYLFKGKGLTCRKCLNPKDYEIFIEKTREKNRKWKKNNPEKFKQRANNYYHDIRNRFIKKGLSVQLALKKECFDFNVFLKENSITDLNKKSEVDYFQDLLIMNNQLLEESEARKNTQKREYGQRKEVKEYRSKWYQENKKKNEN